MPLFERALAIRRRTLGEDHVDVAEALSSLAASLSQLGEHRRALTLSTRAMAIWEKTPTPEAAGYVRSLLAQAAILSAQGRADASLEAYDHARRIQVAVLGPAHPDIAAIEVKRAAILAQIDRKQESLTVALAAEAAGRQHLSLTLGSLPERQALEYAAKRPQGLGLALSLVTADSSASVLDAVVRGRSLVLDEMAMRRRAVNDEAVGPAASLWTTLRQARERLANLVIRGPGSLRPEQYQLSSPGAAGERKRRARTGSAECGIPLGGVSFAIGLERSGRGCRRTACSCPSSDTTARCSLRCHRAQSPGGANRAVLCRIRAATGWRRPHRRAARPAAAIDATVARWRRAMIAEMASESERTAS